MRIRLNCAKDTRMIRSFDRAAATYLQHNTLQRDCARLLLRYLPSTVAGATIQRVLDVGCGTGTLTRLLQKRYPQACVQGIDPSAASLQQLRGVARRVELACRCIRNTT